MSVERNKELVRCYFAAVNRGDEAAILDLTTPDFLFRTMARAPEWLLPQWRREEFARVPEAMSRLLTAPIQLSIVGMIGEGDAVAVEAETDSTLLNGKRYNNRYHFVFECCDGRFSAIREYSCSHLAQSCFGAIDPNEPEKTAMAGG